MPTSPLVSVLVAAHDAERYLRQAVESVLRQTIRDLELVVVDDGSADGTSRILDGIDDERLVVLRNEERAGLAAALNCGLGVARGRYVARLDADDVALPRRLERQLERMERTGVGVLGSGVLEIDADGRPGALHLMPQSPAAVRWAALLGSPFFHPTVLVDRELLERHHLRYDVSYLESEDHDLWARVLAVADGANVAEPLVLYRVHAGQASHRRRDVQREHQLRVARRAIEEIAPALSADEVDLAWRVGAYEPIAAGRLEEAAGAFAALLAGFEARHGRHGEVRAAAARALVRRALIERGTGPTALMRLALRLDPALPLDAARSRARRRALSRRARSEAGRWLRALEVHAGVGLPFRVAAVFPEPTPYRAPLLDRVADHPDVDLTVLYAARTVAGRTWTVEPRHRAVYLTGVSFPGARSVLRHEYPVTPGVVPALERNGPDVVVVSGWSTFAAQAAIAWCRAKDVPYVLVVESHDVDPRPGWRRAVKGTVVPRVVRGAAGILVTGTLARRSMLARGASPERIGVFANTIDVDAFGARAAELAGRREELRQALGAGLDDVVVLSVARLAPEKGHDTLVRAVAAAGAPELLLVLAGDGPARSRLDALARVLGARVTFAGDVAWERVVELYAAADVFALLSAQEPWAVVVNEAAACGLPLVLSDRVGAAHDLLEDGGNGMRVPVGDVEAAGHALARLAGDAELRRAFGARSREIVAGWGYEPSVDALVSAVRAAVLEPARR